MEIYGIALVSFVFLMFYYEFCIKLLSR